LKLTNWIAYCFALHHHQALFMEPEYDHVLEIPPGKTLEDVQDSSLALPVCVLPLKARWTSGQLFGEFHHATVSAFTVTQQE
jgi:hypothetical protein